MTGAGSGTFGDPSSSGNITDISVHSGDTKIRRPGPIVIDSQGHLWLTEQPDNRNSITSGLFKMENPETDASFINLTTDQYRNSVTSPSGIDVSTDGYMYISQNGVGVIKIRLH